MEAFRVKLVSVSERVKTLRWTGRLLSAYWVTKTEERAKLEKPTTISLTK